jgi:hypothetical protein
MGLVITGARLYQRAAYMSGLALGAFVRGMDAKGKVDRRIVQPRMIAPSRVGFDN